MCQVRLELLLGHKLHETHMHAPTCVHACNRGPPIVPLLLTPIERCKRLKNQDWKQH